MLIQRLKHGDHFGRPTVNQLTKVAAIFCCCLLVAAGCSRKSPTSTETASESVDSSNGSSSPGVATIDVNAVAMVTGELGRINSEIDTKEKELNLILEGMRKIHSQQMEELKKKIGPSADETQNQSLTELQTKQANEYNRKWQETRLQLTSLKQKLDGLFLSRLEPIAKKVATEKGLSVVIRKENVFCLVDEFDITQAVTTAYESKHPQATSTKAPEKVAAIPNRGGEFVPQR